METTNQTGAKARITLLLFAALLLTPCVSGVNVQENVRLQPSSCGNHYSVYDTFADLSATEIAINSTHVSFTGDYIDVWSVSNGTVLVDTNGSFGCPSDNDTIFVRDFFNITGGNGTVINMTGGLTDLRIFFRMTGEDTNFTVIMDDLGGECNYIKENASGVFNSTILVDYNSTQTAIQCPVDGLIKDAGVNDVQIRILEGEGISVLSIAAAIAAAGAAVYTIRVVGRKKSA